jgi:hypothetical protein
MTQENAKDGALVLPPEMIRSWFEDFLRMAANGEHGSWQKRTQLMLGTLSPAPESPAPEEAGEWSWQKRASQLLLGTSPAEADDWLVSNNPPRRYSEEKARPLFERAAAADVDADAALCLIAARLIRPVRSLPPLLAAHIRKVLFDRAYSRPPRRAGNDPHAKTDRDICVILVVKMVCDLLGLQATRNDATIEKECGCSIVADALGMKERGVSDIWEKRKQLMLLE